MTNSRTHASNATKTADALLAAEIKRLRVDAKMSQPQLAHQIGYSRQYVSLAERVGKNVPSEELVRAIDSALNAGGSLLKLRSRAKKEQAARRDPAASAIPPELDWIVPTSTGTNRASIGLPAGRFFGGSSIDVQKFSAVDDGRIVVAVPAGFAGDQFLSRPRRGLIIGISQLAGRSRHFGLDSRRVRVRLAHSTEDAPLLIPHAYELDDLTLGIL